MKTKLTGSTGGIGSAIKQVLSEHEFVETTQDVDWLICAHGFIGEQDIEKNFVVNTILCIRLTNQVLPTLKQGVIYISSTAAMTANSRFPVYSASKAAVNIYAKAMAKAHPELQFYAICPGPTNTKMWRNLKLEGEAQEPSEVAAVVRNAMNGWYKSGAIITIRNGVVSV